MFKLSVIYLEGRTARWDGGKTSWRHMGAACTDVRDIPQGQELCSAGRAFTLHIQVYSAGIIWWHKVWAQTPQLPVQFTACAWKPGAPAELTPVWILSATTFSDSSVTARAGQFLCSQHLGAAGALPEPWHCCATILMFCGIIYRWNIQGQGQGRCWEDNRQSRKTCWIYTAPWHSLIWSECWGAEYLWAEHESSQVKQPFLGARIYRAVFALQESNKAVPEEHRFTGSSSSSWELLAGCGCAFQELSPDQLLRAKSQLLSAGIKSKTGFKIEPECAFHQQRKSGWEMWKTLTRTDFMMVISPMKQK